MGFLEKADAKMMPKWDKKKHTFYWCAKKKKPGKEVSGFSIRRFSN